jgi:hypothetical protein
MKIEIVLTETETRTFKTSESDRLLLVSQGYEILNTAGRRSSVEFLAADGSLLRRLVTS